MGLDVDLLIEVDRQRPDAESDSTSKTLRGGRYGEAYTQNIVQSNHNLSDEGSYQVATNPTPGTGIAGAVNAAVSETAGNLLFIKNNDVQGNSRAVRIYLDYIRLILTATPISGLTGHFIMKTDNKDRYSSGGTTITPVNVNIDSGLATLAQIFFGALTTVAPSPSARLVSRGIMRSVIPVVNDEWIFKFGCIEAASSISLAGTLAQRMVIPCSPIILGPQSNFCFQPWFPSNAVTPASYEFEIGYFER